MTTSYIIQKRVINTDFLISKTKKARKVTIEGANLEIKLKNDKPVCTICLKNVIETDIIYLKKYRKTDKLIQIIFVEDKEKLRIMRLNIQDDQIDNLNHKIHELSVREIDGIKMLKICSHCSTKDSRDSRYCNQCGHELQGTPQSILS
jgi:hypothetical protein